MTQLIIRKYKEFYNQFRVVVKGHDPFPNNLEFYVGTPHNGLIDISLKKPIYLPKWPISKGLPDPSVDVSIDFKITVQYNEKRGEKQHTRSQVYVTYFNCDLHTHTAEVLENLRFDFHPDTDDIDHPLLHAHIFSKNEPDMLPEQLRKKCTINWEPLKKKKLSELRLPIPNMTFPSVLCCLVACHLESERLKTLLEKTKNHRESFPSLAISEDQLKLFSDNSFAGSQWFLRP